MTGRTSASDLMAQGHAFKPRRIVMGFIAGFLAVPLFHQSVLAVIAVLGIVSAEPYSSDPAALTGLPQVLSRALLGGVYGMVLVLLLSRFTRPGASRTFWVAAIGLGALVPSMVAWFILAPLKGNALAAGGDLTRLVVTLLKNAGWGAGTAVLYRLLQRLWPK